MNRLGIATFALLLFLGVPVFAQNMKNIAPPLFRGASDPSATVAIGQNLFLTACDETNTLLLYSTTSDTLPVAEYELTAFLQPDPKKPETDIEDATRVGNRVYWITSHGRDKKGKMATSRLRFFATTVMLRDGEVTVEPVGSPRSDLMHEMATLDWAKKMGLDRATRFDATDLKKKERKRLAPKADGVNIEALAASPDGSILYIGFRNPLIRFDPTAAPRALVVPLMNAADVVEQGTRPTFGEPLLWDLGCLGLREMEYWPEMGAFLIVAGPPAGRNRRLYTWSGDRADPPLALGPFPAMAGDSFNPESVALFPGGRALFLSDDGDEVVSVSGAAACREPDDLLPGNRCMNKHLADPLEKRFRAFWWRLPDVR